MSQVSTMRFGICLRRRHRVVECWFAERTNNERRRGVHRSVRALKGAIRTFFAVHHANGQPFVWTRTADEIPASIARFARRTPVLVPAC